MPGIVRITSQRPADECASVVGAMVSSMNHESFYVSGICSVPQLGIYGGWLAHKGSFAADQNVSNAEAQIALLFAGECLGADREIVDLYPQEARRCFRRLNGLFSGVLIDKRLRKMFLFNDRYGMERIYWHEADGEFYLASEAKALLRRLTLVTVTKRENHIHEINAVLTVEAVKRLLFRDSSHNDRKPNRVRLGECNRYSTG
jgi:asparagine synthase (glutamine-hydrolysing)